MSRMKLGIILAVALGVVVFAVGGSVVNNASAANPIPVVPYYYLSNYSVKFVCGESKGPVREAKDFGEGLVKPGNYATVINIHNYTYKEVGLRKKVVVLARDPFQATINNVIQQFPPFRARETEDPGTVGQPQEHYRKLLKPDGATFDDCTALWNMAFPGFPLTSIPTPMPFFEGYLVILSPLDIDVDTVYTAESYTTNAPAGVANQSTGISIDVERTNGKRVYCPPASDAGVPFPICVATIAADSVQANDPNLVPLNK